MTSRALGGVIRLGNYSEQGICPSWQVVPSGVRGSHRAFHFSMLRFSLLVFLSSTASSAGRLTQPWLLTGLRTRGT